MKSRTSKILGWVFATPVALFHAFASIGKFMPVVPGSAADVFMTKVGMKGLEFQLGVLELIVLVLFLIPRTSTVGFVLMIGYMGGVLAANLTHGFTFMECLPIYITFVFLTLTGWFRHPELTARLLKRPVQI